MGWAAAPRSVVKKSEFSGLAGLCHSRLTNHYLLLFEKAPASRPVGEGDRQKDWLAGIETKWRGPCARIGE